MQLNYNQKSKMRLIGALGLLFTLASCGSYQQAGYEDGIYGTTGKTVAYQEVAIQGTTTSQNSNYYQNYFKEKSQELDYFAQEDAVFTDIDSYEGNYEVENDTLVEVPESYAGWGQNNTTEVSINVYSSGFGYNNLWYRPYYIGYGYPFYGYGGGYFGFGYGNFGFGFPHYGYGGGFYGNNYYGGRGLAYNSGRRSSIYTNSNTSRSGLNSGRSFSRSRNTNGFTSRRSSTRTSRSNTVTRPRTTTIRRGTNNTTRPNTRRRVNTNTRSNTRSTPTRSTTRSNYSPSRSRSTTRSSSTSRSSVRSSSSSRSGRSSGRSSGSSRRGGNN